MQTAKGYTTQKYRADFRKDREHGISEWKMEVSSFMDVNCGNAGRLRKYSHGSRCNYVRK